MLCCSSAPSVFNRIFFFSGISDLRIALVERAQTTLRHVVGARAVQSVVTEREAIAFEIAEIVGDVADVRLFFRCHQSAKS